jgi:hypothetical protein
VGSEVALLKLIFEMVNPGNQVRGIGVASDVEIGINNGTRIRIMITMIELDFLIILPPLVWSIE